jgi:hypothetical protein
LTNQTIPGAKESAAEHIIINQPKLPKARRDICFIKLVFRLIFITDSRIMNRINLTTSSTGDKLINTGLMTAEGAASVH